MNEDDKNQTPDTVKPKQRASVCQVSMIAYAAQKQKEEEEEAEKKATEKEIQIVTIPEAGAAAGVAAGIGGIVNVKGHLPQLGNVVLVPNNGATSSRWDTVGVSMGVPISSPRRNSDCGLANRSFNPSGLQPNLLRGAMKTLNPSSSYPGVSVPNAPAPRIHYGGGRIWKPPGEMRMRKPPIAHTGSPGYQQY